jgi:hypothetical protein
MAHPLYPSRSAASDAARPPRWPPHCNSATHTVTGTPGTAQIAITLAS